MKINTKSLTLSLLISTIGLSVSAQEKENLITIKNPSQIVVEICNNSVNNIPVEVVKNTEFQKCVFLIEQDFASKDISSNLKKLKLNKETISNADISEVRTTKNVLLTVKALREAMLLPEGKTAEFERIGSLYKDPNIDIKEKEKEAEIFYKKFNEENYNVSKEVYNSFVALNSNLENQKNKAIETEKYIKNIDLDKLKFFEDGAEKNALIEEMEKDFERKMKTFEKNYEKEIEINKEILSSYNNYILARKLQAEDVLNKIVENKEVKLSRKECNLLDKMYKGYEIKNYENLSCSWF